MSVREIEAKSVLRRHKKVDSWFVSRYGMNLYRGCTHSCVYCDGRAEGYYVEGEFGRDVSVKVNAVEVLRRELDPARRRVPLKPGYIIVGGGVGDSYQPLEKRYKLCRRALEAIEIYNFPVHILTKSTLVERDGDILRRINQRRGAIVSFSFSSVNAEISSILEPGVPPPLDRLKAMARFKRMGIACGMFLLPVVPFITDSPTLMEEAVAAARDVAADFIIFGGMTLKAGRQRDYFLEAISRCYPQRAPKYGQIYTGSKWGEPTKDYAEPLYRTFNAIARKYRVPQRVPPSLYKDILDENDRVVVMLEHIDHLLKMEGKKSSLGYSAYAVSQLKQPLSMTDLSAVKGINKEAQGIISEILETGNSSQLEELLFG